MIDSMNQPGGSAGGNMATQMAGMQVGMMMGQQMVDQMKTSQSSYAPTGTAPMPNVQQPIAQQTNVPVQTQNNGAAPKFCPNCGQPTNGANFCGNCGNKLI